MWLKYNLSPLNLNEGTASFCPTRAHYVSSRDCQTVTTTECTLSSFMNNIRYYNKVILFSFAITTTAMYHEKIF